MPQPSRPAHQPPTGLTWESFVVSALWRLVGLLTLLVVVVGVLASSWAVAINTARLSLLVLLVLSTWLYIVWFRRQRAELSRRDEVQQDKSQNYRLG
ncbi:MAG: hypothetical protein WKF47_17240 [Geodermatophilaceae bacterium]|nr:hypothetical protein [Geodermatophilaceae bacterium]